MLLDHDEDFLAELSCRNGLVGMQNAMMSPLSNFHPQTLHEAAKNGAVEDLTRLIVAGRDVNATDKGYYRWTPMNLAAYNGRGEMIGRLVAAGGDINGADNNGGTPASLARQHGHDELADRLDEAGF